MRTLPTAAELRRILVEEKKRKKAARRRAKRREREIAWATQAVESDRHKKRIKEVEKIRKGQWSPPPRDFVCLRHNLYLVPKETAFPPSQPNRSSEKETHFLGSCCPLPQCTKGGESMGTGLRTLADIPKGSKIGQYTGLVYPQDDSDRVIRYGATLETDGNYSPNLVIDSEIFGNNLRYINHSCSPNCEFVAEWSDGEKKIFVKAKRDIKSKEFLSYHYGDHYEDFFPNGICLCDFCCSKAIWADRLRKKI
jgi:hypothetical protein